VLLRIGTHEQRRERHEGDHRETSVRDTCVCTELKRRALEMCVRCVTLTTGRKWCVVLSLSLNPRSRALSNECERRAFYLHTLLTILPCRNFERARFEMSVRSPSRLADASCRSPMQYLPQISSLSHHLFVSILFAIVRVHRCLWRVHCPSCMHSSRRACGARGDCIASRFSVS
jgi:hypothetical protein